MFQYAFSKAVKLAQGSNEPLVFNFNSVYRYGSPEDGFEDSLQYFNVEEYKTDDRLMRKYSNFVQKVIYLLYRCDSKIGFKTKRRDSWYSFFRNYGLFFFKGSVYTGQIYYPAFQKYIRSGKPKRIICRGKFEIPTLFEHIRPILIEEFTSKQPPKPENMDLLNMITSSNSICVSVRRGDYLSDRFINNFYVCDENYYITAIEKIKEMVSNPVFILL